MVSLILETKGSMSRMSVAWNCLHDPCMTPPVANVCACVLSPLKMKMKPRAVFLSTKTKINYLDRLHLFQLRSKYCIFPIIHFLIEREMFLKVFRKSMNHDPQIFQDLHISLSILLHKIPYLWLLAIKRYVLWFVKNLSFVNTSFVICRNTLYVHFSWNVDF